MIEFKLFCCVFYPTRPTGRQINRPKVEHNSKMALQMAMQKSFQAILLSVLFKLANFGKSTSSTK